jgi:4-hydroxy-3-methylbut-2-enyl diphosphate reductase IspH
MPSIIVEVETGDSARQVKDLAAALEQLKRAAAGAGAAAKAAGGAQKTQETARRAADTSTRSAAAQKKFNDSLFGMAAASKQAALAWSKLETQIGIGRVSQDEALKIQAKYERSLGLTTTTLDRYRQKQKEAAATAKDAGQKQAQAARDIAKAAADQQRAQRDLNRALDKYLPLGNQKAATDRKVAAEAKKITETYKAAGRSAEVSKDAAGGFNQLAASFSVIAFGPLSGIGSRLIAINRILSLSSNALNIWTGAALAAGASIAVLAGAFKAFQAVKNIAADLDKAQKAADRLGVTFQSFQALEFVAARSGLEGIERVLQRLGRAVGDSIRETGEARDAFNDLGLSWRELAKLTPVEQIIRLSDAFVALGDAQKGVSIASQIFGARQARAINILLTRGGGIDKMIQRARDLGLVLDESAGRQAERLTDRMTELDLQFQVLGQRIALEFMPAIERALQRLVEEFPSALARLSLLIQDLPLLPDFRTTGSAFLEMVRIAEKLTEIQERNKELQETPDRGSRTAIFEGGVSRGYLGDLILAEEKTNKLEESTLKLNLALLALFRASQSAVDEQDIEEVRAFAEVVRNLIPDELSKTKLFPGFITDAEEANKAIDEYLARVITLGELLDRVAVKNAGAFTVAPEARAAILKIRQLNDEIASTGRIISQLTGPDVDFATIIRAEEAGVEARKFTDVIRNLRNQVSQYNAVVDILNAQREAGTPLGFELKALEDAEITAEDATNAIEKLDDALTGLFTEKSQGNALEALRVSLVRSTFEQKQQLSIIQAQGADRAILAERIKAETAARRANEGVIDEETAALIEQREILARELCRSHRTRTGRRDRVLRRLLRCGALWVARTRCADDS